MDRVIYRHYGKTFDENLIATCINKQCNLLKPKGLWACNRSTDDWKHWCMAENFNVNSLKTYFDFKLNNHKILYINKKEDVLPYIEQDDILGKWSNQVYADYDGIFMTDEGLYRLKDYRNLFSEDNKAIFLSTMASSFDVPSLCLWNYKGIDVLE